MFKLSPKTIVEFADIAKWTEHQYDMSWNQCHTVIDHNLSNCTLYDRDTVADILDVNTKEIIQEFMEYHELDEIFWIYE